MKILMQIWICDMAREWNIQIKHDKIISGRGVFMDAENVSVIEKSAYDRLQAALDRVLSEVKMSTDADFYEHCKDKVERILKEGK